MDLVSQLVRDEGEVLHAYQDSLGFWTIGSGILIDVHGGGITHDENLYLLNNRAEKARAWVSNNLPWTVNLDEVRRAVLENMAYNMGTKLLGFHNALALIQQGNYDAAAQEMLNSTWAKQVGARATRLAEQMKTGQWV